MSSAVQGDCLLVSTPISKPPEERALFLTRRCMIEGFHIQDMHTCQSSMYARTIREYTDLRLHAQSATYSLQEPLLWRISIRHVFVCPLASTCNNANDPTLFHKPA